MANIHDVFPSKYLKSADLKGSQPILIFERVEIEEMRAGEEALVAYFRGREKGMVVNKSKANILASVYGPETENWIGEYVQLYETTVDFQGKRTPSIGIKIPTKAEQREFEAKHGNKVATAPPSKQPAHATSDDDEVPF